MRISRAHLLAAMDMRQAAIDDLEAYSKGRAEDVNVPVLVTLADLYRLNGDADRSKAMIDRAEKADPNGQAVVHARLLWLLSQNRHAELAGIGSRYMAAREQDAGMMLSAASALSAAGPAELRAEAVTLFERAAALAPAATEARMGLATCLYQMGQVERAEKVYRELLEQYPEDARVLNDLAWIVQEQYRRYDEALQLANKGLSREPDDVHLLDTRGTILLNMPGRLAEARKDFERITQLAASDTRRQVRTHLQLGRICLKLNDPAKAREHLNRALELDGQIHTLTQQERAEIDGVMQQTGR